MGRQRTIVFFVSVLVFFAGAPVTPRSASTGYFGDSLYTTQIQGLPNLCQVSDDLYRCAQPTAKGLQKLKAMGIRTIINLSFHSDRDGIGSTGLAYENMPMIAWPLPPEEKQVVRFLRIVTDKRRTPVLVHCKHGADRTGVMCAVYRIAVQEWTKEEAIKEMTEGGFGFHKAWGNHLIQWINDLNIDRIKKKAGLSLGSTQRRST